MTGRFRILRWSAVLALACFLAIPSQAAPDLALILNGNDNSLSTTGIPGGSSSLGVAAFSGYPGNGFLTGTRYYAAVSGADAVEVLDAGDLTPVHTLSTGPGTNPYAVTADGAGTVYVTCLLTNEIVRFNTAGAETGRLDVGKAPQGILLVDGLLYVANTGFDFGTYAYDPGTVMVVDPGTWAVTDTIDTALNPQWLAAAGGEVHVICTGDYFSVFGTIDVIETAGHTVDASIPLGGSPGFVTVDGDYGYTTDYFGGIYRYRISDRTVLNDAAAPILFGGNGYSQCAADGAGLLYVTLYGDDAMAALDLNTLLVTDTYATGDGPGSIVLRESMPVPVTLLSFTARASDGRVSLTWGLADAYEAAALMLEMSSASGMRSVHLSPETRTYVDAPLESGEVHYTLKALTRTGEVVLLGERRAAVRITPGLRVLNNPVRGAIRFSAPGVDGQVPVSLFDISGRRVLESPARSSVDVSRLPAGVYFLRVPGYTPARVVVSQQ